ncbi:MULTISPECIES: ABC transporter permease [Nocardiopsis]|uniref:Binding-protein-dependent transport systems inner membrane component n=1 Tax=Nocardiopsis dassonvillei (strain ATCC 23218 / DSM 43111 / CIP 107115 / JCM 7437 / KCTC 9190 / NBRC 14626 / NCTC 10488 / NRRL B-5397 / IMRU 509) TaxID=446468 RepID=D7B515_NOCDD|nr:MULTISPECIES: ABC transporter permease [Nocardiopsis]ADH69036.1 binding-protein-dependent transport systems inner membrane component [Nocardiopsis dassonvillei subsp. dassonvillei DSM 43111]APC37077.1 peptide ABC transporter permease [Nocardiopsis dassonvillei]ASU60030.1 ABC transporter permease [Nocardiopsis dassonvillei]NKY79545.1 ABC transporter permease [Nocardiopsis dassonvillei]VEI89545.1 Dipeptide transport system permease protein dppB [Nocardiopsis dassonvillei]
MLRFIVRRLLQLIPTLGGLSILLFVWLQRLPGGPEYALLPDDATAEQRAALRRSLGLDEPITVQYLAFLRRILQGDLGTSLSTGRPVTEEFLTRFPATFELSVTAMLIAVVIGVPLGYLAARRRGSVLDFAAVGGSLLGICTPVFFLAFILKVVFAERLGMFPSAFRLSPGLIRTDLSGFVVLDGLRTGELDVVWDALLHLVLPGIALASIPLAVIVRMTRASVLEVVGEDYVRTANAKGLHRNTVRTRHVMRNAMLPVVTSVGLLTGSLFAGAVLTESVFAFPGIGSFVYAATQGRDYPVLTGFILLIATMYVFINLLVDISYSLLDPRVRAQ